jgi:ribosomal protein RSM22 (predicted rRNA methylase)
VIMMELEKLKCKIEDRGQLYIPKYVCERIEECIEYLTADIDEKFMSYTVDQKVEEAFKRVKRVYAKRSKGYKYNIYIDLWDIIAYLRYYFLENYPKIKWILLNNLKKDLEIIPRKSLIRILDFGAGPGTASMAICDFFMDAKDAGVYDDAEVELYFGEKNKNFIKCYNQMLEKHEIVKGIDQIFIGKKYKKDFYDIIAVSNVLNELNSEEQERLIDMSSRGLKDGGYLIIIEPAYKGLRKYIGDFLNPNSSDFRE